MTDEEFQENLRIGTEAEDKVYAWLKLHYSFVQDMRYQSHDKGSGPRLEGTGGIVVLPDFAFYDKFKGKCLLDVKHKTKNFFTVDDYKMRDYLRCVELMNAEGLVLCFVFEDEMYFYDSTEKAGPIQFNNAYGKAAYKFEFDRSKIKK
jgi:hypothetical protein